MKTKKLITLALAGLMISSFTARFYGPKMAIIDGACKMPRPVKIK